MPYAAVAFAPSEVSAYCRARLPKLAQRGRQWRGACPLHQGKRFSFSVNPETGCWYCFAECGRGGDLLALEMALTGADFRSALAAVCAIVGRPMPERARMTRGEWHAAQEAQKREQQDALEALYSADAAAMMAESILEELDPWNKERAVHTRLIEGLRKDARAVYRDWRHRDPPMASALVEAGRRLDLRLQTRLLHFVQKMAVEDQGNAA